MTQERLTEIARTHGCLLARGDALVPNCHERTSCDCTVLELIAELAASEEENDALAAELARCAVVVGAASDLKNMRTRYGRMEFINALVPLFDAVEALDVESGQP